MKKLVIVALAVLLATPVLSHAGAVTSKWDINIAGFVAAFGQFSDQNDGFWGPGTSSARRTGVHENKSNEYGNFAEQVDPRIGFFIKGPDVWGAKTSARLEFDFAGAYSGTNGTARMRHIYMKFDWANDSVLFGNAGSPYRSTGVGMGPGTGTTVALPGAFGGPRETQLTWTHRFGKNFSTIFALVHPGLEGYKSTASNNNYTQGNYPNVEGVVKYTSDACGKIGSSNLVVALAGIYGRQKIDRGASTTAAGRTVYSQRQEDGWYGQASFQIPIIPERKMNKAGAVLLWLNASAGQGLSLYNGVLSLAAYDRSAYGVEHDYSKPRGVAYEAGLGVWFSNQVWLSAQYNSQDRHVSNYYVARVGTDSVWTRNQLYNLAIFYEPSPAVRLIAEYSRLHTNYARTDLVTTEYYKKYGTTNAIRFGAYYYF